MTDEQPWSTVPDEREEEWCRVFSGIYGTVPPKVLEACPVCRAPTLRYYFTVGRRSRYDLRGRPTLGLGSSWEWCSSCRRYQHQSCFVPDWWSPPYAVDERLLTTKPERLDAALRMFEVKHSR